MMLRHPDPSLLYILISFPLSISHSVSIPLQGWIHSNQLTSPSYSLLLSASFLMPLHMSDPPQSMEQILQDTTQNLLNPHQKTWISNRYLLIIPTPSKHYQDILRPVFYLNFSLYPFLSIWPFLSFISHINSVRKRKYILLWQIQQINYFDIVLCLLTFVWREILNELILILGVVHPDERLC